MNKKSINLLIIAEPEPYYLTRLKKISTWVSAILVSIFLITYIVSLIYIQANNKDYQQMKKQYEELEKDIQKTKSTESIYLTTIGILDTIKKIKASDNLIIINTLPLIYNNRNEGTNIIISSIDNQGPVGFSVKSESIETLESFIKELNQLENNGNFTNIQAAGIIRETDGSYNLSVNLNANKPRNEKS